MEYSLFTTVDELSAVSQEEILERKKRRVKRLKEEPQSELNFDDVPGVVKLSLCPTTQLLLQCVVGTDLTDEIRWKYISTDEIVKNMNDYKVSSEFIPFKNDIYLYEGKQMLLIYISNDSEERDEFYFCVSDETEKELYAILKERQNKQEENLKLCVEKSARPWKTQGSEREVARMTEKSNRPLLLVEVETNYPIKYKQCKFRFRYVENARDGYVEILSGRTAFNNAWKSRIDAFVQVKPSFTSNEAQTVYTFPKDAYSQYEFGGTIELDEVNKQKFNKFVLDKVNNCISDLIYVNSCINFYNNDYRSLINDLKFTMVPEVVSITEYMSLVDPNSESGVPIANISWHPMWTGVLAIAYSEEASNSYRKSKPTGDEVNKAVYDPKPILLWSFKDGLFPKLYLETYRDVSVVSFCPYDENLLIAGCINGQIVIWDLKDKLKKVEAEEFLTDKQKIFRKLMFSLVDWMKITRNIQRMRPTAVTNLEYSHRSPVSSIKWFSPYREMTKTGKIREILPSEERHGLSFMSASRDGTVLNWDLNLSAASNIIRHPKTLKRLKKRPTALVSEVSPYKSLDKHLCPLFKVIILRPGTTRPLPICSISIRNTMPKYVEVNPDPNRAFDITDRVLYKPIFNKAQHPITSKVIIGSAEGDFLVANWSGFDTNSGETVNKEVAIVESFAKFHDGPIVSVQRTELFPDMCLTVGGKVFAIWKQDLVGKPVFWKRSKYRYTHGTWSINRPSMFRLTRSDGCLEFWHLKTRSDMYQDIRHISAKGLSGCISHPLPLKQNVMGIADDNGSLRLFYVTQNLIGVNEDDRDSTNKLCDREVMRKKMLMQWQQNWSTRNADLLKEKYEIKLLEQQCKEEKLLQEKAALQKEKERLEKEAALQSAAAKPQPGRYKEWAQAQLLVKERERINKILLEKKSLDLDVLVKQQIPIMKIIQEESKRKAKQKKHLGNAEMLLEDAVRVIFPSALIRRKTPSPDPYISCDLPQMKTEIVNKYKIISLECDKFIKDHPHGYTFNWSEVLREGKERRQILDGCYSRYSHKERFQKQKRARLQAKANIAPGDLTSSKSEESMSVNLE